MHLSISEIHDALLRSRVTPLELVKEAIELAKKDNNNCFEYICEKEAIEFAKKLDQSKMGSPLYGIPVVIKDNFSTKDIPTCGSSNILKDYVPVFSSEVVNRLQEAGAIIIGKTTMDELGMGGSGTVGHLGATYNPWDITKLHRIGGSSCGSAAAIASGIVPFSIGSDTGDSVRKPASYGGSVGLKPTWGRISRFGLFPFATSLDHVGYFTRNVYDSALVLNILAGRDEKDYSSSFMPVDDYTKRLHESIKGKKIAVIKEIMDSITDENILSTFNNILLKLKQKGAVIDYVSVDFKLLKAIYPTYIIISSAESTSNNANLDGIKFGLREPGNTYEEIVFNTRTKGFSRLIKSRFIIGGYSLLKENREELFIRAQKCRRLIVNAFTSILNEYDAIYCPASPTTAPKINSDLETYTSDYIVADDYMAFANMGGFPSITLPIGFKDGLPFGGNLTAKQFDESNLFSIAQTVEEITGLKNLVATEDN